LLIERASWLPVAQDFFSRIWLVVVGAGVGLFSIAARYRTTRPGERLLVLWFVIGLVELVAHDSGNARRYVMFIPALVALTALILDRSTTAEPAPSAAAPLIPAERLVGPVLILVLGYIVAGSLIRLVFLQDVLDGHFSLTVRLSAGLAAGLAALAWWH
jgi:hypothetical protein